MQIINGLALWLYTHTFKVPFEKANVVVLPSTRLLQGLGIKFIMVLENMRSNYGIACSHNVAEFSLKKIT